MDTAKKSPGTRIGVSPRQGRLTFTLMLLLALGAALALPQGAAAQPFNTYLGWTGNPTHGYVRIPHSTALNPTSGFTFEAWVRIHDANGSSCSSIAGKGYTTAWWIGVCGTQLRAYLKGGGSAHTIGTIPADVWTHIAVTWDGSNQRHYINGELVGTFAVTGPLTTNTNEVRIGSDVNWQFTPAGRIDEVRFWNVARTVAQIRSAINEPITSPQTGLVSVWHFQSNLNDAIGSHDGSGQGSGQGFFILGTSANCGASTVNQLCLNSRFAITTAFRTGAPGTAEGQGHVVVAGAGSGIFWFFDSSNWEVMVKAINACSLNSRHWIFSAATTNVFYRMEVLDVTRGETKIYFNYPGPPAPAVTDTNAFATCP